MQSFTCTPLPIRAKSTSYVHGHVPFGIPAREAYNSGQGMGSQTHERDVSLRGPHQILPGPCGLAARRISSIALTVMCRYVVGPRFVIVNRKLNMGLLVHGILASAFALEPNSSLRCRGLFCVAPVSLIGAFRDKRLLRYRFGPL